LFTTFFTVVISTTVVGVVNYYINKY